MSHDAGALSSYLPTSVYPSRPGCFPAASFLSAAAEWDYIREVQGYPGTFGICTCPARSFEMLKSWWREPKA